MLYNEKCVKCILEYSNDNARFECQTHSVAFNLVSVHFFMLILNSEEKNTEINAPA